LLIKILCVLCVSAVKPGEGELMAGGNPLLLAALDYAARGWSISPGLRTLTALSSRRLSVRPRPGQPEEDLLTHRRSPPIHTF